MAAKKRASTQSKLLKRAVKAGRTALRQAERRVPPDLRKQLERTIRDGQKTIHTAIKEVQTRLDRTARQADLDKAMKRLEGLSKQVRNLATGSAASTTPARPARRKSGARKAAAGKPAARKPAAKRMSTKRAATRSARVVRSPAAPAPTPEPDPERVDGF
jgi:polyhydroxyalkanoate synthesis regulator phasin